MTMISTSPAAAPRSRALLTTQASPFALCATGAGWRDRDLHNSINSNSVVVPGHMAKGGYGAAKQAAPPRGVPR